MAGTTSADNIGERNITALLGEEVFMVFVLDTKKRPQPPIHPAEARTALVPFFAMSDT